MRIMVQAKENKGGRIIEEYNMRSGNLNDYKLVDKFSKQIKESIKEEIPDILLGNEGDIYISMNIKQGKYMNRDIKFTKCIKNLYSMTNIICK